jgi:hypothetical protein
MLALTAVAALAIAAAPARERAIARVPEGDQSLQLPAIGRIIARPDTIWFCGIAEVRAARDEYFFARHDRAWGRVVGTPAAACRDSFLRDPQRGDTLVAAGVLVSRLDTTSYDSIGQRSGRVFLSVSDGVFKRHTDVTPRLDSAKRRVLTEKYGSAAGLDFTGVSAIAANDSVLWMGLAGGFPEGEGSVGGLIRLRRRTGEYALLLDTLLDEVTVSAMTEAGRWLWLGTKLPGEYGWYGAYGLLRLDARKQTWRSYTEKSTPLPDAMIRTIASDGRAIAIATARGLAIATLRDANAAAGDAAGDEAIAGWDARYFLPAFARDSLVFELGTKELYQRQATDEVRYNFAQRLALAGHERPLFDALGRVPPDSLTLWMDDFAQWDRIGAMLADTALLPMLFDIASRGQGELLVAGAIGALGKRAPAAAVDSVRRAFGALVAPGASPYNADPWRGAYGRALALAGDSTPIHWARAALQRALARSPATRDSAKRGQLYVSELPAAAGILAAVRDRAGLGHIISAVPVASFAEGTALLQALAAYDDPNAWRALVGFARENRLLRGEAVRALTVSAMRDPTVSDAVVQLIREELRGGADDAPMAVIYGVSELRLHVLAPDLVRLLSRQPSSEWSRYVGEMAIRVLVSLTGRADAPVFAEDVPPRSAVEWWARLAAQPGGLPRVSAEQGRRAEAEWGKRMAAVRPAP